jgi:hypothetical protein
MPLVPVRLGHRLQWKVIGSTKKCNKADRESKNYIAFILYRGIKIFNIGCINKKEWKKEGIIITIE